MVIESYGAHVKVRTLFTKGPQRRLHVYALADAPAGLG